MSHDNGRGPLTFPPAVPILGQPFTIRGWFPTVLLICGCEAHEPVMVPRGAVGRCPACRRLFSIDAVTGNVQFGIGVGADAERPPQAQEIVHG